MIRARFNVNLDDPRSIDWPIKHPYWVSGEDDNGFILIAYADNEEELLSHWPEAENIEVTEEEKYTFSSRFLRPNWLKESTDVK